MKIRDMNISARAKSCLLGAGYMFASEIMNLADEQLLSIRNLNEKCLEEIREALDNYTPEDEKKELYNERISHSSSRSSRLDNAIQEDEEDEEEDFDEDEEEDYDEEEEETSGIVTAAKSAYKAVSNVSLNVLDHDWDSDDITGLIQYDVIRIAGVVYLLADENERQTIINRIQKLFDLSNPQKIIENIIDDFNAKTIISELYRRLPYSVGLMFEYDQQEEDSNLSYTFYEVLRLITLSVICPDGSLHVNNKAVVFTGIMETIKNHLLCSGISEGKSYITLPKFSDICQMYDFSVDDYVEIDRVDNGKALYDALVNNLKKSESLVERSASSQIDSTYSRKRYQEITEEMQNMDFRISITEKIFSNLRFEITVNGKTIGDDDDEDDDDYTLYGQKVDVDELWEKIYENEDKALEKYGDSCKLIIRDTSDWDDREFKTGTLIQCLKYAQESMKELGEGEWFLIQYGDRDYHTTGAFCHFADGIQKVWSLIRSIPEPFDNSIIPDTYKHFSNDRINDNNFKLLWDELQKIENKYRKGINYENRYNITDWESELCYEQGKLLENVFWVGNEINTVPDTAIPYCTYSKMNQNQLKYYLYWRTRFRNGENIFTNGVMTFYFLCVYELLAEFGPFSPEERLEQLERLYKNYKSQGLSNARWVGQYADVHGLRIKDEDVIKWAYPGSGETDYFSDIVDIIEGKYDHAFDYMCRKSAWKLKSSSFIKKASCMDKIQEVVEMMLPKLETLFDDSGIKLSDFLAGRLREEEWTSYNSYYSGTVWNDCVIKKLGIENAGKAEYHKRLTYDYPSGRIYITDEEGNVRRKTNTCMHYTDPYLSEYVLKYTEMLFRQKLGYGYLTFPTKLIGALKMKFADGYSYVLSADPELQKAEKIYISLYGDIEKIILDTVEEYFNTHVAEIDALAERFKVEYQPPKPPVFERKTPVDELMTTCICEGQIKEEQFEELLKIYDDASPSFKKSKAKKISKWIWDFWILRDNHTSYKELEEKVVNNKWFLTEKKAIIERKYDVALPYLCATYDALNGVASKKVDADLIKDCIIISFTLIDRLFDLYGVDSSDIILGEWKTIPWIPFENAEEIKDVKHVAVQKNIGDLELYSIDDLNTEGNVSRHEYSEQAEAFISYILKSIENRLRALTGYKSLLSNSVDLRGLSDVSGYKQACDFVDDIIVGVVNHVYGNSTPLKYSEPVIPEIAVSGVAVRNYTYSCTNLSYGIEDVDAFVKEGLKGFYGDSYSEVEVAAPYEIIDLDLENFDFEKCCKKYDGDKTDVYQTFAKINIYRFHDIYDDVLDRFTDVSDNYPVEYDPKYNFMATSVMNEINGLIGKDLATLSSLLSESEGFLQWLAWIEHGKIIIPKNMPYIQIMFHFAFNRMIFADEPEKCLVVMSEIWNYYFASAEKADDSSNLLLEWIKDYWMVYCPEIEYETFKRLLRHNVIFENENNITYAKEHYMVDISGLKNDNLLDFYNSNCDYHVLDGTVVRKGYRNVLEEAIEEVHKDLTTLWEEYDLDFEEYLHYETKERQDKQRELFFRGILTGKTKRFLRTSFEGRDISDTESYTVGYNYDRSWPVLEYEQFEISNSSSRILLDYIIKYTEKVVRDHLRMSYNFKFDDQKMYDLFPVPLFYDNMQRHTIARTIIAASDRVCRRNGL